MEQEKQDKGITANQLYYLTDLANKVNIPELKEVVFSELTKKQASKLIEVLIFALKYNNKNVVYEYSNGFLNDCVEHCLSEQK